MATDDRRQDQRTRLERLETREGAIPLAALAICFELRELRAELEELRESTRGPRGGGS